jgi:4-hydroxybenzoate polyprenyltransferase
MALPVPAAALSPATFLHTLHLYGAAAVTAFGWAMCELVGWDATPWMPLWFCGALLIYNADRLRRDPADDHNVPERAAAAQRLHALSAAVTVAAAAVLFGLPLWRHDWITLVLAVLGSMVCLSYSVPLLGFRLKDVPVLKTFVAPTVVAASILVLPWLHEEPPPDPLYFAVVAVRAWGLLLFNMILCDLRDVEGDRQTGIVSLPGALGGLGTRRLLIGMLIVFEAAALLLISRVPAEQSAPWLILCVLGPLYLGWLIAAVRRRQSERFYEWWVEGMFFLPGLAVLLGR